MNIFLLFCLVYLYFVAIFLVCWLKIEDYGVTLDDELYYRNGVNSYEYIKNFFLSLFNNEINLFEYKSKVKEWPIVFELFLVFICNIFNINQIEGIYLTSLNYNTGLKASFGEKDTIIEALKARDINNIDNNELISINSYDKLIKYRQFY